MNGKQLLIAACVFMLGLPILFCGGCIVLGVIGAAVTPIEPDPPAAPSPKPSPSRPPEQPNPQEKPQETPQPSFFSPVITSAEYQQLATGISYEEAVRIIGSPGEEVSRTDLAGTTTVMYMWKNTNGSNANAMFQNGKLVTKAQFGLR